MLQQPQWSISREPDRSRANEEEVRAASTFGDTGYSPSAIPFRCQSRTLYDVEVAFQKSGDVVYHFFPKRGNLEFHLGWRVFGILLEDAIVTIVGRSVQAKADYLPTEISKNFSRAESPDAALGQPTFWVELKGVGNRPGSEYMLVDKVLQRLDEFLSRAAGMSLEKNRAQLFDEIKTRRWRS